MSLYDDLGLDGIREKADQVAGWSSSIKLLQSQLQLKNKTAQVQQPRRDHHRKAGSVLAPVIDLKKSRRDDGHHSDHHDSNKSSGGFSNYSSNKESRRSFSSHSRSSNGSSAKSEQDWHWDDEYDPMWPNDYEKVVKDLKDKQDREREKEEDDRRKKNREDRDRRGRESVRSRYDDDRRKVAGFAGRPDSEEEEEEEQPPKQMRGGGAAIAPPPSLQEVSNDSPKRPSFSGDSYGMMGGSSVAAKIMAKYGFKEGQGLGKKEQGIAMALQVEKTSKRGGRIISDKDIMSLAPQAPNSPQPPPAASLSPPPPSFNAMPPPPSMNQDKPEPSITEMMKNPSKVVLLRNMVGPGEVDEDLEPEVKDECNTKYGDVIRVVIFEVQNVIPEETVRIFVEFKRIESAIKAVVDLNGRFFGGRQVKAGFYSWEKLNNNELL